MSPTLIQKSTIWAGDFNLHHVDWDSHTINPTPQARSLAEWITDIGGSYALRQGTTTHRQGGALDLVISSSSMTPDVLECYVNQNLDATSDHEVISTSIAISGRSKAILKEARFQFKKLDDKIFHSTLQAQTDIIQTELVLVQESVRFSEGRKEKLDQCAAKILSTIHQSLVLSTPRIGNSGKGEPWWNSQCQDAVQLLRNRRREDILEKAVGIENPASEEQLKSLRYQLRKEVKQAKRRYYQEVINNLNGETIFQAMKWPNSIRKYNTPPIQKPDGSLARSNKDKQAVLKQVLLTPTVYGAFDSDIRLANLSEDSRDVAMEWNTCTYQKVEEAVMHAGNTSPGVDETLMK